MKKFYKIGAGLLGTGLLCYSLIPSEGLKYLWKRRSRRKSRDLRAAKRLYLTFDDGPSREYTGQLLMLLKQYEIKASFFVVEEFARKNPMLIERMKEEGHLVGLHSVRHENALFRGRKFVHRDLEQSIAAMEKMGGDPCYYRPPWGHLNLWTLYYCRQRNLKLTFWDVMAHDWSAKETSETIKKKLLKRVFPGAVICLHDGRGKDGAPKRTVEALRGALPILLKQGYTFERMDSYEWF
ncbi:MAG: polysaccharide deacetylase family protein [Dorea sp.]|jgi:peptidoglycan/xylan/chitin deacetylase (PgdA/CDA1 family)|nr:polysaccharide deacetylase family protein [Dorea sp.]